MFLKQSFCFFSFFYILERQFFCGQRNVPCFCLTKHIPPFRYSKISMHYFSIIPQVSFFFIFCLCKFFCLFVYFFRFNGFPYVLSIIYHIPYTHFSFHIQKYKCVLFRLQFIYFFCYIHIFFNTKLSKPKVFCTHKPSAR